jgi:uncharacterized protein YeaC (DUF1315 family)
MDFNSLVLAMSAETYTKLVEAVSTRRWADGSLLTDTQHAQSMQLVMAYQSKVLKSDEPFTIGSDGQMVIKSKTEMKAQFGADNAIARFVHNDL